MYQTYIKGYMGLPHLSQTHEASRMRLPCQCYKHNNPQSRDFPDLIGVDGTQHNVNIVDVIDTKTIQVDEDLRQYIGSFDEEGNVIIQTETTTITLEEYEALEDKSGFVKEEDTYTKTITSNVGNSILVRGEKVDDFLSIKKNYLWTIATSALQEVDRQLQVEKDKVASLEARISALENNQMVPFRILPYSSRTSSKILEDQRAGVGRSSVIYREVG